MEQNNKLIAEFMGLDTEMFKSGKVNYYYYDKVSKQEIFLEAHELSYNVSWDWLMTVVEKINLLDDYRYTVYIASMDTKIVDNISGNVIVEIDCKHSIDELRQSVYEAVVEFIKNQNN